MVDQQAIDEAMRKAFLNGCMFRNEWRVASDQE
jgi:hypothetical protein